MNKWLMSLAPLGLALGLMTSCNDDLSNIGEGIQTRSDVVESEKYYLQFEAKTVASPTLYTGNATAGLIGAYSDPVYGDFSADFVTQFRHAPGFAFEHEPTSGQVDSVTLRLLFSPSNGYIGSTKAPLELSVYETPSTFTGSEESSSSLAQYADVSRRLAEQVITIEQDKRSIVSSSDSSYYIPIKLNPAIGQRIYEASKSHPEYFTTQEAFSKNLLSGLYITTSTGRGAVIKVLATAMTIYYTYSNEGKSVVGSKTFINTKLTAHQDGLSNQNIASLTASSTTHTYSKGPAGVQTAITLGREQMARLLASKPQSTSIGSQWTLSDTQLKLTVDNPTEVLLNPPTYMMLMPADVVSSYFKKGLTERSSEATSYLSTAYSSASPVYNFYNISRIITEHLKQHAKYVSGAWTVDADLDLRLIPVERTATSSSTTGETVTTSINEYLYPSFVRLKKDEAALKIGVVSSIFK